MQIDLWYAPAAIDEPGGLEDRCLGWLCDEETERAGRFRRPTSRHQFIVGRGMCRRLLAKRLAMDPAQIRFELEPHGKPRLAEPAPSTVQFNVAHTEGMVLCGLVDGPAIGVDIERLCRRTDLALAKRYFAPSEAEWVLRQPETQRLAAFLRVWTLKEAFIKAIGTGLRTPLDAFAFERITSPRPVIRFLNPSLGTSEDWCFFVPDLAPGFVSAVAIGCGETRSDDQNLELRVERFS